MTRPGAKGPSGPCVCAGWPGRPIMATNGYGGGPMTERNTDDGTEPAVRHLAATAGLALEDEDIARLVAVARENQASAQRLAERAARWDELAYGLPARRPRGVRP
jgi:plasmid stability protein